MPPSTSPCPCVCLSAAVSCPSSLGQSWHHSSSLLLPSPPVFGSLANPVVAVFMWCAQSDSCHHPRTTAFVLLSSAHAPLVPTQRRSQRRLCCQGQLRCSYGFPFSGLTATRPAPPPGPASDVDHTPPSLTLPSQKLPSPFPDCAV